MHRASPQTPPGVYSAPDTLAGLGEGKGKREDGEEGKERGEEWERGGKWGKGRDRGEGGANGEEKERRREGTGGQSLILNAGIDATVLAY